MLLLGPVAESYLSQLADTDRSLTRQVRELFELIRDYGQEAVAGAVQKARAARAFAPITSPTFCASRMCVARCSHRFVSASRS